MLNTFKTQRSNLARILEPALYLAGCLAFSYKPLFGLAYFAGLATLYSYQKVIKADTGIKFRMGILVTINVFLCFELINYFISINRINSFLFIEFIAFFLLAGYVFTKWLYPEFSIRIVIFVFGLIGAYHYWDTIHHLIGFIEPDPESRIRMLLYSRDTYIPQGMNQGWVTKLVSFFPFVLLLFPMANRPFQFGVLLILACAAVFSIILCLGRAGILAMVFILTLFLILIVWTRYYPLIRISSFMLVGLGVLAIALFPFREPVVTTFKMGETEIQRSSAASRTEVFSAAWDHLPKIPMGVGSINFSLYYQTTPEVSKDRPYLLHANSIVSEWLIEKGWIGSLLYFLIFLFAGIWIISRFLSTERKQLRLIMGIAAAGIAGMLLRDVFFATIPRNEGVFINLVTLFGIVIIAGLNRGWNLPPFKFNRRKWGRWLLVMPMAFIGWTIVHGSLTYAGRKLNYKAILALEKKEYDQAVQYLNRAIKYIPRDGRVFLHLSYIQAIQAIGEPEVVPENYHPSIVISPEKLEEAIHNLETCIHFSPRDDSYYHLQAWLQFLADDPERAEACINEAISIYPHQPEYYLTRGIILNSQGQSFQSAEAFKKGVFMDPGLCFSVFWNRLSEQFKFDRQTLLKEIVTQSSWDLTQSSDLAKLGALYYFSGAHDLALEYLKSALEIQPNFSRPYLYLGMIDLCNGQRESAIDMLSNSVALNRRDYIVLLTLAGLIEGVDPQRAEQLERSATFYYHDLKTAHTDRRRSRYKDRPPWIRNDFMPPSILYYYSSEFRSISQDCE